MRCRKLSSFSVDNSRGDELKVKKGSPPHSSGLIFSKAKVVEEENTKTINKIIRHITQKQIDMITSLLFAQNNLIAMRFYIIVLTTTEIITLMNEYIFHKLVHNWTK